MFSGVKKDPKFVEKQRQSILKTLNSEGYVHPNTGMRIARTMKEFTEITFTPSDIVRSSLVKSWIIACENMET